MKTLKPSSLKLSPNEQLVYDIIKRKKEVSIASIAMAIFVDVKPEHRPRSINNSVVSFIRQINRKLAAAGMDLTIGGRNLGRRGKFVYFTETKSKKGN